MQKNKLIAIIFPFIILILPAFPQNVIGFGFSYTAGKIQLDYEDEARTVSRISSTTSFGFNLHESIRLILKANQDFWLQEYIMDGTDVYFYRNKFLIKDLSIILNYQVSQLLNMEATFNHSLVPLFCEQPGITFDTAQFSFSAALNEKIRTGISLTPYFYENLVYSHLIPAFFLDIKFTNLITFLLNTSFYQQQINNEIILDITFPTINILSTSINIRMDKQGIQFAAGGEISLKGLKKADTIVLDKPVSFTGKAAVLNKVVLKEKPDFNSKNLADTLEQGTAVEITERAPYRKVPGKDGKKMDFWYKIRLINEKDQKVTEGWVFGLDLTLFTDEEQGVKS